MKVRIDSGRARRASTFAGLGLVAVLTLSACTPSEPAAELPAQSSPSAAPQPTTSTSGQAVGPASSEEAIEDATAVLMKFQDLQNQISRDGIADPDQVDAVATGAAKSGALGLAGENANGQYVITGGVTISVEDAYTTDPTMGDGTVVPFGTAQIVYCADTTTRSVTMADGTAVPASSMPIFVIEATVQYLPELGAWKVASTTGKAEEC